MDWAANLDTAAFGALVSAAAGVLVPRIIERVPEPEPDEPARRADRDGRCGRGRRAGEPRFEGGSEPDEPPKETYHAIADRPGLLWKSRARGRCVTGGLIGLGARLAVGAAGLAAARPGRALALAVIDWRTRLLPTWLIAAHLRPRGRCSRCWPPLFTQDWQDLVRAGIGWAGAGLLYFVLWFIYPRGLGYGDVRLSGVLGIALGYVGTAELVVGRVRRVPARRRRRRAADDAADRAPQARAVRAVHVGRRRRSGLLVGDWVGGLTTG